MILKIFLKYYNRLNRSRLAKSLCLDGQMDDDEIPEY